MKYNEIQHNWFELFFHWIKNEMVLKSMVKKMVVTGPWQFPKSSWCRTGVWVGHLSKGFNDTDSISCVLVKDDCDRYGVVTDGDGCDVVTDGGDDCCVVTDDGDGWGVLTDGCYDCGVITDGRDGFGEVTG